MGDVHDSIVYYVTGVDGVVLHDCKCILFEALTVTNNRPFYNSQKAFVCNNTTT